MDAVSDARLFSCTLDAKNHRSFLVLFLVLFLFFLHVHSYMDICICMRWRGRGGGLCIIVSACIKWATRPSWEVL